MSRVTRSTRRDPVLAAAMAGFDDGEQAYEMIAAFERREVLVPIGSVASK
jgi:hypothetical protein